jgi:hypothetical protein
MLSRTAIAASTHSESVVKAVRKAGTIVQLEMYQEAEQLQWWIKGALVHTSKETADGGQQ